MDEPVAMPEILEHVEMPGEVRLGVGVRVVIDARTPACAARWTTMSNVSPSSAARERSSRSAMSALRKTKPGAVSRAREAAPP